MMKLLKILFQFVLRTGLFNKQTKFFSNLSATPFQTKQSIFRYKTHETPHMHIKTINCTTGVKMNVCQFPDL